MDDPHGFRDAEIQIVYAQDMLDRLGNEGSRAADCVEEGSQRSIFQAAFADHAN